MNKKQRRAIAQRKLNLERLDSRQLLTGIIFDSAQGEVRIDGSSGPDQVTVSIDPRSSAYDDDVLQVELRMGTVVQTQSIPLYGLVGPEIGRVVNKISFQGFAGDDTFRNNTSLSSFASGGLGTDRLYGGSGVNTFYGGGGTDHLYGGALNDFLDGGVPGAVYSDNTGDDYVYGGSGDDTLHASDFGNCTLDGANDNDTLYGWQGNDRLYGGSGHDTLQGFTGSDRLDGGSGNDRYIFGNSTSSGEVDTLVEYAGFGTDRLEFTDLSSTNPVTVDLTSDTAVARHANRLVTMAYTGQAANFETVYGGRGNDDITGNIQWNTLYGGSGADTIRGGGGVDSIYGEAGDDVLFGDDSGDHLHGGTENDTLYGSSGSDYLYGEDGNDKLYGGTGTDNLYGMDGDDGLFGGTGWTDQLRGGIGDDRFLLVTGEYDTFSDFAGVDDVKLVFRNGTALTNKSFAGRDPEARWDFAAGTWTDAQIEEADATFATVQDATDNTRLMKRANDPLGASPMTYVMQGAGTQVAGPTDPWGVGGWNSGGDVYFPGSLTTRTILHEIGHNWDSAGELGATRRTEWENISGWVQRDTRPSMNHSASSGVGDNWWMRSDAAFAGSYALMNPEEDMGNTFAAYFSRVDNSAVRGDGTNITGAPGSTTADNIPLKIAFLDRLFDSLA